MRNKWLFSRMTPHVTSDVELDKMTENSYKQMAFLQNEFSYDASDVELEKVLKVKEI